MEQISGNVKTYAVITTTEYHNDGHWAIQVAKDEDLCELGFEIEEEIKITNMLVGEVLSDWDFKGVVVVRIA